MPTITMTPEEAAVVKATLLDYSRLAELSGPISDMSKLDVLIAARTLRRIADRF